MSVSSHLTPEPERRLWAVLDFLRAEAARADWRLLALTGFSAAELLLLRQAGAHGWLAWAGMCALPAATVFGLFAFAPLARLPGPLAFFEPGKGRQTIDDSFITADDVAKYAHGELVLKMDRYLGGGITATQYHEDLVREIGTNARLAARKRRLLLIQCALVGAGQLALLSLLGS
jgi:hypothetical protein